VRRHIENACPAQNRRAGQIASVYLRAAQAYMLISMPTGTSTIFGVFQVIWGPPTSFGTTLAPGRNVGPPQGQRKCGTTTSVVECGRFDSRSFSLGQGHFSLGQAKRFFRRRDGRPTENSDHDIRRNQPHICTSDSLPLLPPRLNSPCQPSSHRAWRLGPPVPP
jgi:hypothetical protein